MRTTGHGGPRKNAGRPKGSGPHGESTRAMRIPESLIEDVQSLVVSKGYKLPLFSSQVSAGRPLPTDDHIQEYVNLYKKLVPDPENLFCVQANGDSMQNVGIHDGDLLIVNRREPPAHKKVVIASVDGQQTVKTLHIHQGTYTLMPENERYRPILITSEMEFSIQGVVKHCIRSF